MATAAAVGRALLTAVCFAALLAFSSRLVSLPLSDGMGGEPTVLSFGTGSDRSVFAPAAYGEDSQTAVDDDEDIFQSIENLESARKKSKQSSFASKVRFSTFSGDC